jgi:rubrerythrin
MMAQSNKYKMDNLIKISDTKEFFEKLEELKEEEYFIAIVTGTIVEGSELSWCPPCNTAKPLIKEHVIE